MNAELEENTVNGVRINHIEFIGITIRARRTGEAWCAEIQAHISVTERCGEDTGKGESDTSAEEILTILIWVNGRFTPASIEGAIKNHAAFDKEIWAEIILYNAIFSVKIDRRVGCGGRLHFGIARAGLDMTVI